MSAAPIIRMVVNGHTYERRAMARIALSDFLRHELGLTGTHVGCEHGACGACTVLVDGLGVRSCLMLAVQAHGCRVTTVEGLTRADGALSALQEAFRLHHGLQCGFCTPGILMTLAELLSDAPDATEADVRDALSGNLCRCTGYAAIVDAALDALSRSRSASRGSR